MITAESLAPLFAGALVLGGAAVALTRRRELILRWCIWSVAVPLVVALFWVEHPGTAALAIVAGAIATVEYGTLMGLGQVDQMVVALAVTGVVLTTWWDPDQSFRVVGVGMLAVAVAPIVAGDATHGLRRVSAGVLGVAWFSPLAGVVPLGATALALFAAVSVADVVAFFVGPKLGGPALSPLSPAKRWSGALVGAVAGVGVMAAVHALTWQLAVAVAIGGPAGDLFESMVKRGVRTKDSGTWLAGAGGLLDRIDSLLMALAVLLVLT
jgi:phosphatidate cytidylyltransferase